MSLRHVAIAVAALSAGGYLYDLVAHSSLQDQSEYKAVLATPTFDNTEKLLVVNKESDDRSLMATYLRVWKSTMAQEATSARQVQLQALYDAGRNWVAKAVIDGRDMNIWLYVEKDAAVNQLQTAPTPLDVAEKALKLTEWNMKKIAINSNYQYSYQTLDRLLADHTSACKIYSKYPQTHDIYQNIKQIVKSLANTRALEPHNGRGSIYKETHEIQYTQPFTNPTCDSSSISLS